MVKERETKKQKGRDRARDRKREGGGMRVRERTCGHELLLAAIMAVFYYNASNYNYFKFLQNMYYNHYHINIWSVVYFSCAIVESFEQRFESIRWTEKAVNIVNRRTVRCEYAEVSEVVKEV